LTGLSEGIGSIDAMSEEPIQELAYNDASYEEFAALLADGADVNTQDLYGDTPLHNLLYGEGADIDTVELLLESGADVSLENEDGMTPAELAADSGQPTGIIELIQSYE
jgi:ankyrin repeat protein